MGVSAAEGASSASAMSVEDLEAAQALERPESAGNAACCLNDTFEVRHLACRHAIHRAFPQTLTLPCT